MTDKLHNAADRAPEHSGAWPDGPPWWTSAVVYQIYPRSFADSDGDGVGRARPEPSPRRRRPVEHRELS